MQSCLGAIVVITLVLMSAPSSVGFQLFGNPKVKIPFTHPPQIPLNGVTRIAVLPLRDRSPENKCGVGLANHLTQSLVASEKFEVAARSELSQLRAEVEAQLRLGSGFDDKTKTKLLRILGPAALVVGEVTTCEHHTNSEQTERQRLFEKTPRPWVISKTRAYVAGSLQLVELATGRIYSARAFEGRHESVAQGPGTSIEPPPANEVMAEAQKSAVAEFMKTIVPWTETVEVLLYDDKKWSLNKGAAFVKAGEFDRAAAIFREAIETNGGAQADASMLAKAYHNLGVTLMYSSHAREGLQALLKSLDLEPKRATEEAARKCRALIASEDELKAQSTHAPGLVAAGSGPAPHTIRCPHCGASAVAGAKFCRSCGKRIEQEVRVCANRKCGARLGLNDRYCSVCGTAVRE